MPLGSSIWRIHSSVVPHTPPSRVQAMVIGRRDIPLSIHSLWKTCTLWLFLSNEVWVYSKEEAPGEWTGAWGCWRLVQVVDSESPVSHAGYKAAVGYRTRLWGPKVRMGENDHLHSTALSERATCGNPWSWKLRYRCSDWRTKGEVTHLFLRIPAESIIQTVQGRERKPDTDMLTKT